MDFGQPNVLFALNLIIDSEERKHSLKILSEGVKWLCVCQVLFVCSCPSYLQIFHQTLAQVVKTIFENHP